MHRAAAITALLLLALPGAAEIVDRLAVTAGDQVITASDVDLSIRVAAFLNGEDPQFTPQSRREAANRLTEQALLRREMSISRFPVPADAEVNAMLASLKKQEFSDEASYKAALAACRITEEQLRQQLQWQARLLRFIDFRFTPGIQLSPEDLQDYYDKEFLPRWRAKTREAPPGLEESRSEIERDVNAKKANDALEEWLKSARTQMEIAVHEEAFQ